ncbi:MAG: hypothetical protein QUS09_02040 [Methanotrichaceae archaeon]|nr:hypothetical protein [Methanotrichaceae archaeon]
MLAFFACGLAAGTPALKEPVQDGEFCNRLKVAGTGSFEVGVSVKDRELALEYYNFMYGDGDLEMDTNTVEAQRASRLQESAGNDSAQLLNLFEGTRMTYSGKTPLVGVKYIHSKAFWGGIGAEVTETFSVTEMDREGTTFFASTNPASYLKDPKKIAEVLGVSPVHTVGISTRNAFNGTWETNSRMHKFFSKDVKSHERFSGKFEVEKLLKFHENPVPEQKSIGCEGIDC